MKGISLIKFHRVLRVLCCVAVLLLVGFLEIYFSIYLLTTTVFAIDCKDNYNFANGNFVVVSLFIFLFH